jgi:hypothetical protein
MRYQLGHHSFPMFGELNVIQGVVGKVSYLPMPGLDLIAG